MTTYLATQEIPMIIRSLKTGVTNSNETLVSTFCGPQCRHNWTMGILTKVTVRDDDSYEFDETCANCGVLVPASAKDQCSEYTTNGEGEQCKNDATVLVEFDDGSVWPTCGLHGALLRDRRGLRIVERIAQ